MKCNIPRYELLIFTLTFIKFNSNSDSIVFQAILYAMEGNNSPRLKGKFLVKKPKEKHTQTIHTGAVQKKLAVRCCHDAAIKAIAAGNESTIPSHLEDTPTAAYINSNVGSRKKTKADLTHELRCTIIE